MKIKWIQKCIRQFHQFCGIEKLREGGPSGIKSQLKTMILQSTLDSAWGNNLNLKTYNP